MAKRGIVRRLQSQIEDLQRQLAEVTAIAKRPVDPDTDKDFIEGWQSATGIVAKHYEPLVDAWTEIEHAIGIAQGLVVSAHRVGRLEAVRPELVNLALDMGYRLNDADFHSRALAAVFGLDQWIDMSRAHSIRDAMLNYVNGSDKDGARLVGVLVYNDRIKQTVRSIASLKPPRKAKGAESDTVFIVQHMVKVLAENNPPTIEAAALAASEALYQSRARRCEPASAAAYYYRYRNKEWAQVSNS